MGLLDLFKRPSGTSSKPESRDLSLDALLRLFQSKASADKIYDP